MTGVLVTGARSPGARHVGLLFRAAGWRVVMGDSLPVWSGTGDRTALPFFQLPPAAQEPVAHAQAVAELLRDHDLGMVAPFNEDALHLAQHRHLLPYNALQAPSFEVLKAAHSKHQFACDAAAFGMGVPHTEVLCESVVDSWSHPWGATVAKPVWSRFGHQTRVGLARAEALALARGSVGWVLQHRVEGEEVCLTAVAFQGRVVALSAYTPAFRVGNGAGVAFEPRDPALFRADVERYVAATGWTGLVGFDAIVPPGGRVCFIECNPRGTSGVHFFRDGPAFADAWVGGASVIPDPTPLRLGSAMVAFALPSAVRSGRLGAWRRFWSGSQDAMDVLAKGSWIGPLATSWALARRGPGTLLERATRDIAWTEGRA